MRSFPLYDLKWQEFENLVRLICERILGTGTINFSTGTDGGMDGKFTGKAQNYPSQKDPWDGKFIIQAKHTEKKDAKCSDSDFKRKLREEIQNNLKDLVENNQVDYYLIFTNRRLAGTTYIEISKIINDKLKNDELMIKFEIFGDERIQSWLKEYPEIVRTLGLNKLFIPIDFYEKQLKEIVIKFAEMKDKTGERIEKKQSEIKWIDKEKKNELNNLTKEYFLHMRRDSFSYFHKIENFLKDVVNREYKKFYYNTAFDLQERIIVKRREYDKFEEILVDLCDYVVDCNKDLIDKKKMIYLFLHYMYFNCDIGVENKQC